MCAGCLVNFPILLAFEVGMLVVGADGVLFSHRVVMVLRNAIWRNQSPFYGAVLAPF